MNPANFLPSGISIETLVEIVAGMANFLVLLALQRAFSTKDLVNDRARAHAKRRRDLRSQMLSPRRQRREKSIGAVRSLLERLKLTRGEEVRKATELLAQAGWRTPDALTIFLGLRLGMPLSVGAAAYLVGPSLMPEMSSSLRIFVCFVGITAGGFAPSLLVKQAIERRRQQIHRGLPDALDLFVICAEAGLSLDSATSRVAREIGPSSPELADELGLTAIELGFLPNRRDALNNLGKRIDSPSIRGLINTLAQSERYGTPLAQSLRVLATEFRNNRMMKAEEKAARLPATLSVPMILFVLPPLFVVLLGPAIIQVMASMGK
jgi:tight adherence protein C